MIRFAQRQVRRALLKPRALPARSGPFLSLQTRHIFLSDGHTPMDEDEDEDGEGVQDSLVKPPGSIKSIRGSRGEPVNEPLNVIAPERGFSENKSMNHPAPGSKPRFSTPPPKEKGPVIDHNKPPPLKLGYVIVRGLINCMFKCLLLYFVVVIFHM